MKTKTAQPIHSFHTAGKPVGNWDHLLTNGVVLRAVDPNETDHPAGILDPEFADEIERLTEFARRVLFILEGQEEWSSSTPDDIAAAAFAGEVGHCNAEGMFRAGPKPTK